MTYSVETDREEAKEIRIKDNITRTLFSQTKQNNTKRRTDCESISFLS